MGCDIHGFMEVRKTVNGEKKWVSADLFKKNEYFDTDEDEPEFRVVDAFGDRNYAAFAQLCGVRDYSDDNPKISEPRGIPDDVAEVAKAEFERWDGDGHSHSYVTLRDVIDFRESLTETVVTGMISAEQAKALDEGGEVPRSWCGWTSRDGYVKRSWKVMFDPLKELEEVMRERLREFLWCWTDESINENAENIRYVFCFDN